MNYRLPLAARAVFAALAIAVLSTAAAAEKGPRPKKGKGPSPARQLIDSATERVYKEIGGVKLRLYIFNPPDLRAGPNRAAIVLFHGGGGKPASFARQCRYLASRGMVAITAGRREQGSTLDLMKDGRSAMRWVRAHAAELHIDPRRIACGGGSQGGGIALATALARRINNEGDDLSISPTPGALVLFNPGTGVRDNLEESDKLKYRPEELPLLPDANQLRNLTKDAPPMIIFHGTADKVVPFATVVEFTARAQSLGVRCQLVPYPGREHSFFDEGRAFADTLEKTDQFLTALGYLPPRRP
jgi:acetyl esterase/lipase